MVRSTGPRRIVAGLGMGLSTLALAVDVSPAGAQSTPRVDDRIVIDSEHTGNDEIYIVNGDGSGVVQLTNHPAQDSAPVWSPDGRRIAFVSDRNEKADIYVMGTDGANLTRLTEDPE